MSVHSEEHEMLRDSARAFVQETMPTTHLRAVRDAGGQGYDKQKWAEIIAMGWTGIVVPEAQGGSALGYVGMGLVLEEMGRTLAPSPLLSAGLIGPAALQLAGSAAQQSAWLPKIAAGEVIFALAVDEGSHHAPRALRTSAAPTHGGFALNGAKAYVADGHAADQLIVAAQQGGQIGFFLAPVSAAGVNVRVLNTVDGRGAADISFDGVQVPSSDVLHAPSPAGADLLDQILDRARIGLAAEMLGQATQAFETTVEYLKTRTQFGQLIGSFQSLQHRAAKMFSELELTRSCVLDALAALDENRNDIAACASLAKARISDTLHLISNEMVQMHGGIGMTDAADPGLYLKRARVTEMLYGGAAFHRDRYATLSGF